MQFSRGGGRKSPRGAKIFPWGAAAPPLLPAPTHKSDLQLWFLFFRYYDLFDFYSRTLNKINKTFFHKIHNTHAEDFTPSVVQAQDFASTQPKTVQKVFGFVVIQVYAKKFKSGSCFEIRGDESLNFLTLTPHLLRNCSGSCSWFGENAELQILFNPFWEAAKTIKTIVIFMEWKIVKLQHLLLFSGKTSTPTPIRLQENMLYSGSDSTPALVVDYLWLWFNTTTSSTLHYNSTIIHKHSLFQRVLLNTVCPFNFNR